MWSLDWTLQKSVLPHLKKKRKSKADSDTTPEDDVAEEAPLEYNALHADISMDAHEYIGQMTTHLTDARKKNLHMAGYPK